MTHPDINLEQRLVAALHQEASLAMTTTDTPRELERWRDQRKRRKNRLQIGLAVAAAAAVIAIVLGVTLGLSGSDDSNREPIKQPPAPTAPSSVSLKSLDGLPAGTKVATASGPVNPGAVAFGAIWATGIDKTADELYRIDQASGAVLSDTHITPPTLADDFLAARIGDRVLVPGKANGKSGYAVLDKSGTVVDVLPVQRPGLVAGDATGGWVEVGPSTVAQVDSSGTKILQRVQVADPDTGALMRGLAVAGDSVYVTTQLPTSVYRIDASTGEVTDTLELDSTPSKVAATESGVYVATESYELLRIDPALNGVTAVSTNELPINSFYLPFIGPNDSLWATPDHGGIVELDPTTLEPVRSFKLFPNPEPGWNFGGAVSDSRIFVGDARDSRVASIPLD